MLKKTIEFEDFNGNKQSKAFYFNLTEAELAEMLLTAGGGDLASNLQAIVDTNDGKLIIAKFKEILAMSYGERSHDGQEFNKSPEIVARFEASAAYSVFFMELVTDAEASAAFIRGLVPAKYASAAPAPKDARAASEAQMQGFQKKTVQDKSLEQVPEIPTTAAPVLEAQEPSIEELEAMLAKRRAQ